MRFCVLTAVLLLAAVARGQEEQTSWTIRAETVYTASGEALADRSVVVRDGKIDGVVAGGASADLEVAAVTPGMIDLSARISLGMSSVEQSREVAPEMRVASSLNVFDVAWARQARSGVTCVLVNPIDENVIGGYGVLLKTAGPDSIEARTVKDKAAMRGAIGTQPSRRNHPARGRPDDFYSRRPTTRMGVEWEHRKAFYDAAAAKRDPARAFPGCEDLQAVLAGEVPLLIQAWATQDIRTAVFLVEEIEREGLGQARLIVDAAAEAWREPQLLVRSGAAVVLPPFALEGRTTDGAFMTLDSAARLTALGVPVALSSHGAADPAARLDRQAGWAIHGGLAFEDALRAVTLTPARLLGVEDRVGSIEAGKDADLTLWSGRPFEPTSRVIGVLIDGALVLDPREAR